MPKEVTGVTQRASVAPYEVKVKPDEVKVKPKSIAEIQHEVKLVEFYLTLASIYHNFYTNGVVPPALASKRKEFIDAFNKSRIAHPQLIMDEDFKASIKTFNRKDSTFDVKCFDVLLESNLFAVPKIKVIVPPIISTRSNKEICQLADADLYTSWFFTPAALTKLLARDYFDNEYLCCQKTHDSGTRLATYNTKDVEGHSPVKLKPQAVMLMNTKKTKGNYYINHNHRLMTTNSILVFLRQFFYLRLKIIFGETVAKSFSSWIGCEDNLANFYSDKIQEGESTTTYNDRISAVAKRRLLVFFHSTFKECHIERLKKSWNDRRLRIVERIRVDSNLSVTDAVIFELARGLELKSFAKSTYKLAVCLKDLIVELTNLKEDVDAALADCDMPCFNDTFKNSVLEDNFKSILKNLRPDSVNVVLAHGQDTCTINQYHIVDYDVLARHPDGLTTVPPYQFILFFKTFDERFTCEEDDSFTRMRIEGCYFDEAVLKTTVDAYLVFISCMAVFMESGVLVDREFKDMCDKEISFISRLKLVELLGLSTQVVADISKCFFEDYPTRTSSSLNFGLSCLDPVMRHLFYFNILFRFPDLKHLIIE
jgi:hypothetical protein